MWHKHRSALGKRISRPAEISRYIVEMNDVITNLVGKMRLTRQPDMVVPNLDEELFKWAMECKYCSEDSLMQIQEHFFIRDR